MNDLIRVSYESDQPTVSGRDLHTFLEVDSNYTTWFKRMCEYGFEEGKDFFPKLEESPVPVMGRPAVDHTLTVAMAKEICMLQRTDKGKEARQYFIALEAAWNTPELVMSRALKMAEKKIEYLSTTASQLSTQVMVMQPKAEYYDALVDTKLLTSFRETAKELEVGEKEFIDFLLTRKYIYRNRRDKLLPYAERNDGLFEVKEFFESATQDAGVQTLITPKGRAMFRLLFKN
jgi:anti-repressor protein